MTDVELEALQQRFPMGSTWLWRPGGQSTTGTEAFIVTNVGFTRDNAWRPLASTGWRPVVIDTKGQKWFADGGAGTLERIDTPMTRREELEQEIAVHERWALGRSALESPSLVVAAVGRAWRRVSRLNGPPALAEARAELAALEQISSACRDWPLLSADYSQIEHRVLAHLSDEEEREPPREEQSEPFHVVVYDTVRGVYGPGCEFGLRGNSAPHIRELSEYGTCKRCNSTPRDRLAARRQNFEFNVDVGEFCLSRFLSRSKTGENDEEYKLLCEFYAKATDHEIDRVWLARCYGQHAFAPTRALAIEALWTKLETKPEVIMPWARVNTLPIRIRTEL